MSLEDKEARRGCAEVQRPQTQPVSIPHGASACHPVVVLEMSSFCSNRQLTAGQSLQGRSSQTLLDLPRLNPGSETELKMPENLPG